MTASRSYRIGYLVGVRVFGGIGDFLGLATEQIEALGALDSQRVVTLLRAANAAAFFTREESRSGAAGPAVRAWHVRLCHGGRTRLLDSPEALPHLGTAVLIRLACDCLSARQAMAIEDVSQALRDALAASRVPPESAALNHEIGPDAER